jgi:hypothetical protein
MLGYWVAGNPSREYAALGAAMYQLDEVAAGQRETSSKCSPW